MSASRIAARYFGMTKAREVVRIGRTLARSVALRLTMESKMSAAG
jgi:hypothetical protein